MIHHAVVVAEGPAVTVDDLPAELLAAVPAVEADVGPGWGQSEAGHRTDATPGAGGSQGPLPSIGRA